MANTLDQEPQHGYGQTDKGVPGECPRQQVIRMLKEDVGGCFRDISDSIDDEQHSENSRNELGAVNQHAKGKEPQSPEQLRGANAIPVHAEKVVS